MNFGWFQRDEQQQQQQIQVKKRDQTRVVIETELTLNEMMHCLNGLDIFCNRYFHNQIKPNDVKKYNSLLVGSLNIFGSMCNDLVENENRRALDLCSYKLEEFILSKESQSKNKKEFLAPFLKHLHCAVSGKKMEIIPSMKINPNEWNNESVNNFLSNYLGSQHTVDQNIDNIKKNAKQLNKKYDQIWNKRNRSPAKLGSPKKVGWKDVYGISNVSKKDIDFGDDNAEPYISVKDENELVGIDNDYDNDQKLDMDIDMDNDNDNHNHYNFFIGQAIDAIDINFNASKFFGAHIIGIKKNEILVKWDKYPNDKNDQWINNSEYHWRIRLKKSRK